MLNFWINGYEENVVPNHSQLRTGIIHGDINEFNLLVENEEVSGIIDFSDLSSSYIIYDVGIIIFYLLYDKKDFLKPLEKFLDGLSTTSFRMNKQEIESLYWVSGLRGVQTIILTA